MKTNLRSCPVFTHSEIGLLDRAQHVPPKIQAILDRLNSEYQAILDAANTALSDQAAVSIAGVKLIFNHRCEVQQLTRYYRTGRI
jgi:hypothetical protein